MHDQLWINITDELQKYVIIIATSTMHACYILFTTELGSMQGKDAKVDQARIQIYHSMHSIMLYYKQGSEQS